LNCLINEALTINNRAYLSRRRFFQLLRLNGILPVYFIMDSTLATNWAFPVQEMSTFQMSNERRALVLLFVLLKLPEKLFTS
jgi:hypothetical protein